MKASKEMKYNSIMNTNNLMRSCEVAGSVITKELMQLECVVTEKIHGENFRVGVDAEGRSFVGQRNNIFYLTQVIGMRLSDGLLSIVTNHPHWDKMNHEAQQFVGKLLIFCKNKYRETGDSFIFFGELCGNGMQSGFKYPWDGLKVLYFDVLYTSSDGESYYLPNRDAYYWMDYNNVPRVPVVATKITVANALQLNVENMKSEVADSDFIEGVVIKPVDRDAVNELWKFDSRFIIKHKTQRYSEQRQHSKKKTVADIDSPFCDFVTLARIEHAIEKITERGDEEVKYEMSDLRFLRNEVVTDIQNEENEGNPLSKEDLKALNKYIPKVYTTLLSERTMALLGIG